MSPPFLSPTVIREFNDRNRQIASPPRLKLITRREALGRLKERDCSNFKTFTLKDEIVEGESILSHEEEEEETAKQDIHAKLYFWRRDSSSELYLGSLNSTYSAFNGNVELVLRLKTTRRRLDLDKLSKDLFGMSPLS